MAVESSSNANGPKSTTDNNNQTQQQETQQQDSITMLHSQTASQTQLWHASNDSAAIDDKQPHNLSLAAKDAADTLKSNISQRVPNGSGKILNGSKWRMLAKPFAEPKSRGNEIACSTIRDSSTDSGKAVVRDGSSEIINTLPRFEGLNLLADTALKDHIIPQHDFPAVVDLAFESEQRHPLAPSVESHQASENTTLVQSKESGVVNKHFAEWLARNPDARLYTEVSQQTGTRVGEDESDSCLLQDTIKQIEQDPWSNSFVLPHKKIKSTRMYPYSASEIPDEHHEAFSMVVDDLHANVIHFARSCDMEVDYELWMCGSSREDALPSIVVICRKDHLAKVESILTQPHLTDLCNIVLPLSRFRKLMNASISRSNPLRPTGPQFNLYFCPRDTVPAFKLQAELDQVNFEASIALAKGSSGFLFSGSKILVDKDVVSTLACFLKIGAEMFGLTTAHGCRGLPNSRLLVHKGQVFTGRADIVVSRLDSKITGAASDLPCSIILPSVSDESAAIPDFDWALLRIPRHYSTKTLRSLISSSRETIINLGDIATFTRPKTMREVVIYSSVGSQKKIGTLIPGITYQTVSTRSHKVGLWSVATHPGHGLLPGDSGSLVVDSATHMVYGYIVSINTIGLGQIMPLSAAMSQMQSTFGLVHVQLETWSQGSDSKQSNKPSNFLLSNFNDKPHSSHEDKIKSKDESAVAKDVLPVGGQKHQTPEEDLAQLSALFRNSCSFLPLHQLMVRNVPSIFPAYVNVYGDEEEHDKDDDRYEDYDEDDEFYKNYDDDSWTSASYNTEKLGSKATADTRATDFSYRRQLLADWSHGPRTHELSVRDGSSSVNLGGSHHSVKEIV